MGEAAHSELAQRLRERLRALGRDLGEREAPHREALEEAQRRAESLHEAVRVALDGFHEAAAETGAARLRLELSPPRLDDKHAHSVQFDLHRGRCRAIVTFKSRGDVTLVGPFQAGKKEGPCTTLPWDAAAEIEKELAGFLERFIEEAAAP
jgi:hypothetical protein